MSCSKPLLCEAWQNIAKLVKKRTELSASLICLISSAAGGQPITTLAATAITISREYALDWINMNKPNRINLNFNLHWFEFVGWGVKRCKWFTVSHVADRRRALHHGDSWTQKMQPPTLKAQPRPPTSHSFKTPHSLGTELPTLLTFYKTRLINWIQMYRIAWSCTIMSNQSLSIS